MIARKRGWLRRLPGKAKVGAAILAVFLLSRSSARRSPRLTRPRPPPVRRSRSAPNVTHLLGTTATGQDVLSQLLVGTRSTVVLGLLTGLIATILSVVIGMSAGFLGGASDEGLSLLANVFLVLPALPLLVVILGYLPHSGELPTAIVLSALGWPWGARVIRAQTLSLRNRDYVAAARESGERTWRIILFEIFPNEVGLIAASFVGTVLYAILTSVALAFLGVADLSQWSYGTMLYWAQNGNAVQLNAWWWYAPPGICVALLGMSMVLLNFGLDELGNPRLRAAGAAADRAPHVAAFRPDAGAARPATGDGVSTVTEPGADRTREAALETRQPVLDIRDLSIAYRSEAGDVRAVRDVSLALAPGEIVGLAGESGCGKSTLAYGSIRLLRPPAVITGGSVTYHGRRVGRRRRRRPCGKARTSSARSAGARSRSCSRAR